MMCCLVSAHRQPREFSACPLNTNDDVNSWLKHFEASAPLVCQSVLVSRDPVSRVRKPSPEAVSEAVL